MGRDRRRSRKGRQAVIRPSSQIAADCSLLSARSREGSIQRFHNMGDVIHLDTERWGHAQHVLERARFRHDQPGVDFRI
jgi:hypothetical protein